jgi:hypothetical protein
MTTWPDTLPSNPLIAGLQYQPASNATAIPVEAGELLTRRRFTGEMAQISAVMTLTTAQAQDLLSFYRDTLGEVDTFDWTDPLSGDTVEMIFNGAPSFQPISTTHWNAAFTLFTKPVMDVSSP